MEILTVIYIVLSGVSFIRFLTVPTIPDRLIVAEVIGILMAMAMLYLAAFFRLFYLVDLVLIYSILLFVDLLVFAKYFEHRELYR
ncbi:MAG: multicomponent Na+:H+ antiporter subunit [Candidatus Atribacteria bacterium]|nr:multicomponent Na+:H+ antiporter subunit [Candidatus Atribacteria bacterium]